MSDESTKPVIDFNSPKAPPLILAVGSLLWRALAWWQGVDFILSIREEKVAMTLQLLLDWGWLVLAIIGVIWFLGAYKIPSDTTRVHWGTVTCVGILAFMTGTLVTVRAIGASPLVLLSYGGDAVNKTCNAVVDTSRLVGLREKDHVILLCGVSDPKQDPIEDDRISVSGPFTITGQATAISASYGALSSAIAGMPQNPNQGFALWHAVAVIPNDVNTAEIKRVSDVAKRGGKVVTEPLAGAWANVMPVMAPIPTSADPAKKTSSAMVQQ